VEPRSTRSHVKKSPPLISSLSFSRVVAFRARERAVAPSSLRSSPTHDDKKEWTRLDTQQASISTKLITNIQYFTSHQSSTKASIMAAEQPERDDDEEQQVEDKSREGREQSQAMNRMTDMPVSAMWWSSSRVVK
jgi:hypothetical protein